MANPWGAPGVWTSGRRTYKGNRLVGGVANSDHLRGEAADFAGVSEAALRKHFGNRVRYLNEGDHIHVSGLKDVPYHGNKGIAGLVNGVDTTAPKGQPMFQPTNRRLPGQADPITAALGRMTPVVGGFDPLAPVPAPQPPQMAQQTPFPQTNMASMRMQEPQSQPNLAAMTPYSSIKDPLAPKPKAFGKGGAGWAILGAIGDALSAYGGQQGVFAPMMADQMARDQQEKLMRERMNAQAENAIQVAQIKAAMPPKPTQTDRFLAEISDPNTPPERKALLKAYLFRPLIGSVTNPDGSQTSNYYDPTEMGGEDEWEY